LLAFSAFSELKHIFIVDEDVDPFDMSDVLWAMNTRYQGNLDTIFIPGVYCHPLDPSATPEYNASIPQRGVSCKVIFDCTVPFHAKNKFIRSQFMEVDPKKFIPDFNKD
jgi:UbiD family decarboxylase